MNVLMASEIYGALRNDGRSVHHRNELEKVFVMVAAKIAELKEEIERLVAECATCQVGGS